MKVPVVRVLPGVDLDTFRETLSRHGEVISDDEALKTEGRVAGPGPREGQIFVDFPATEQFLNALREAALTDQLELLDPSGANVEAVAEGVRVRVYSKPWRTFVTEAGMMVLRAPQEYLLNPSVIVLICEPVCEGCVEEATRRTAEIVEHRFNVIGLQRGAYVIVAHALGYEISEVSAVRDNPESLGKTGIRQTIDLQRAAEELGQSDEARILLDIAEVLAVRDGGIDDRRLESLMDRTLNKAWTRTEDLLKARSDQRDPAEAVREMVSRVEQILEADRAAWLAVSNAVIKLGSLNQEAALSIAQAARNGTLDPEYSTPWQYSSSPEEPRSMTPADPPVNCSWDRYYRKWQELFAGTEYLMGDEPGPPARRTVTYHRKEREEGGVALDAGCGEGQDLAFLAERGYAVTGIEFIPNGVSKARRLLQDRGLQGEVLLQDLRSLATADDPIPGRTFDLVLVANTLQDLGKDAVACLDRLKRIVRPGGVIGISNVGRDVGEPPDPTMDQYRPTLEELQQELDGWELRETSYVWQYKENDPDPAPFITLIARRPLAEPEKSDPPLKMRFTAAGRLGGIDIGMPKR